MRTLTSWRWLVVCVVSTLLIGCTSDDSSLETRLSSLETSMASDMKELREEQQLVENLREFRLAARLHCQATVARPSFRLGFPLAFDNMYENPLEINEDFTSFSWRSGYTTDYSSSTEFACLGSGQGTDITEWSIEISLEYE